MTDPWRGPARPLGDGELDVLAAARGLSRAHVETVIAVEAGGRFFAGGALPRRFEPHHLPTDLQQRIGWSGGWRASLALDGVPGRRAALFSAAFAADAEAAMRAASWGGPQIMGSHHAVLGYATARDMVADFAASAAAQVRAMLALLDHMGVLGALIACDWLTVARAWNGSGQAAVYAQRLESAWRRITGRASAEVLRVGATGASVRELQASLGVTVDGRFGPATLTAVRAAQEAAGIATDGVVGAETWGALREASAPQTSPLPQPRAQRSLGDTARDIAAGAGTVSAAAAAGGQVTGWLGGLRDLVSPAYGDALVLGVVGAVVVVGGAVVLIGALRGWGRRAG